MCVKQKYFKLLSGKIRNFWPFLHDVITSLMCPFKFQVCTCHYSQVYHYLLFLFLLRMEFCMLRPLLAVGSTGLQKLNYGCLVFLHSFRSLLNENNKIFDKIQNFKGFSHFFNKNPNFCTLIDFFHILTSITI